MVGLVFLCPLGSAGINGQYMGYMSYILQPTYSHGIYWGYNPLILTFDPSTSWPKKIQKIRRALSFGRVFDQRLHVKP